MPPTAEGRPVPPLLGRQEECAALDALLGTVRDGLSGALVLVGEPGIGKTRLLDFAAAQASDVLVARVVGMEAETQLGFAGLHRLLLPFLDRTPALPAPQRAALGAAFGLVAGPPPDRVLVGLAALTLLSDVAVERPLLCLVDDVHWLDRETVEVLAFIGHRLQADGIGMVLGTRDEQPVGQVLAGLPVLALHGLAAPDARRLLLETGGTVAPGAVERVIEETGGNPLALLELGGEQITGPLSPAPLPVGPRMEAHFLRRVRTLPADTQTLLLLISAASTGDPGELWQAATDLGVELDAAEAAVAAGILTRRDRLAFRHPLIRSAVYGGAVAGVGPLPCHRSAGRGLHGPDHRRACAGASADARGRRGTVHRRPRAGGHADLVRGVLRGRGVLGRPGVPGGGRADPDAEPRAWRAARRQ
ncbi:ATP-binding protein [Dactylosporangium sp. NPDC050588]|uniref:ATP-binding protein n=1 Tax=Dactylosporangium sp. NPDC050588 TaxID=3157211 RepID=UPI003404DFEA